MPAWAGWSMVGCCGTMLPDRLMLGPTRLASRVTTAAARFMCDGSVHLSSLLRWWMGVKKSGHVVSETPGQIGADSTRVMVQPTQPGGGVMLYHLIHATQLPRSGEGRNDSLTQGRSQANYPYATYSPHWFDGSSDLVTNHPGQLAHRTSYARPIATPASLLHNWASVAQTACFVHNWASVYIFMGIDFLDLTEVYVIMC